ncbi:GDYXXLXY domain-containing protein [Sediminitomix flava]|uniref:Putative membrane-anchored protein n=1 Tax=Sediminitomix flava TaxID=379075 RepID=A0A315ZG99_SEDFL|nr:GDYXXLXY domain-containing protein [Sediminitomix flava]PWJ43774.1 putative membrane-anchored protein [Sediminitomix flava]
MKNRTYIFLIFLLVALIQLYAPASMIFSSERILSEGETIKLKLRPIDPTDPFRGKYIILNYEDRTLESDSVSEYTSEKNVYLTFKQDSLGYSVPFQLHHELPNNQAALKVNVYTYSSVNEKEEVQINYPHDRFYMEESKAKPAEDLVRKVLQEDQKDCYVLLKVLDGEGVIENVYIGDLPLTSALEE